MIFKGKIILPVLLGIGIGLLAATAVFFCLGRKDANLPQPAAMLPANGQPNALQTSAVPPLLEAAYATADALYNEDYEALAALSHSEDGVLFVPYSTVDKALNLVFTAEQIKKFGSDPTEYIWGQYDGIGEPILLTPAAFCTAFLQMHDFTKAPVIGLNSVVKTGNSLENVAEAFPEAVFADMHYPGFDPELQGIDWLTLRLVFMPEGEALKLVAVIHSAWTI